MDKAPAWPKLTVQVRSYSMEYVALELGPWAEHLQELVVVAMDPHAKYCIYLAPMLKLQVLRLVNGSSDPYAAMWDIRYMEALRHSPGMQHLALDVVDMWDTASVIDYFTMEQEGRLRWALNQPTAGLVEKAAMAEAEAEAEAAEAEAAEGTVQHNTVQYSAEQQAWMLEEEVYDLAMKEQARTEVRPKDEVWCTAPSRRCEPSHPLTLDPSGVPQCMTQLKTLKITLEPEHLGCGVALHVELVGAAWAKGLSALHLIGPLTESTHQQQQQAIRLRLLLPPPSIQ